MRGARGARLTAQKSDDPIEELLLAIRDDGKPSLAWVVRWSEGGKNPVQQAWMASGHPRAMGCLCRVLIGGMHGAIANDVGCYMPHPATDAAYADALRERMPEMPTLECLMESPWLVERRAHR